MHRLTLEVASDTAQAPTWRSSAKSFLVFLDRCPPKMVAKSTQRELSCCLQLEFNAIEGFGWKEKIALAKL